ncbi:IclR family transcriptional regulator [Amycolatopsis nivea]|uniref:IclR family transcriptional regulator n=1 Tax=Amycolatopsis nivea TaxID=1644109 RepID=UPI00106F4DE0|nr:IclR family transcriptional regulator [Amycolatopsis nivea]
MAVESTNRALVVLDMLATSNPGPSIRRVSEQLGLSRSATHRILQSLAEEGYATQSRHGEYSVGPRLVQLAARVMSVSSTAASIEGVMRALVDEVGESAYLSRFDPVDLVAVHVRRVECTKPLRYVHELGTQIPLHAGAAGKAILAECGEDVFERIDRVRYTDNTITAVRTLRAELKAIAKRGFATSVDEYIEGAAGVAAPICVGGAVVGALTVTFPVGRTPEAGLESLGPDVRRYAAQIAQLLSAMGMTSL